MAIGVEPIVVMKWGTGAIDGRVGVDSEGSAGRNGEWVEIPRSDPRFAARLDHGGREGEVASGLSSVDARRGFVRS